MYWHSASAWHCASAKVGMAHLSLCKSYVMLARQQPGHASRQEFGAFARGEARF
jgi:hypothetical protein